MCSSVKVCASLSWPVSERSDARRWHYGLIPSASCFLFDHFVHALLGSAVAMAVAVALQLQPKGRAHGERTDNEQGDAHKELRPGGHGLTVGDAFDAGGDQGENNDPGGMTCTPGQGAATGGEGSVEGKGSYRHEVIRAADDMNNACGQSGENGNDHRCCGFSIQTFDSPLLSL